MGLAGFICAIEIVFYYCCPEEDLQAARSVCAKEADPLIRIVLNYSSYLVLESVSETVVCWRTGTFSAARLR